MDAAQISPSNAATRATATTASAVVILMSRSVPCVRLPPEISSCSRPERHRGPEPG
jgi:hypothetical protein